VNGPIVSARSTIWVQLLVRALRTVNKRYGLLATVVFFHFGRRLLQKQSSTAVEYCGLASAKIALSANHLCDRKTTRGSKRLASGEPGAFWRNRLESRDSIGWQAACHPQGADEI